MIGTGAAILGGAAIAAVGGAVASNKASKAQKQGVYASLDEQRRQFDTTQANQAPWLEAGRNALNQLSNPQANFMASPDYAFRRDEGMRGIERTAAARGGAASGNALKALSEFNSNLASGEFTNWWNRQAGLAGVGQTSANALAGYGAQAAGNMGNSLMAAGDARASGVLGTANSLAGGINSGIRNYLAYRGGMFGQSSTGNGLMAKNWTGSTYGDFA